MADAPQKYFCGAPPGCATEIYFSGEISVARDFLSVESLRSASSRRRELVTNGCNGLEYIGDSTLNTVKCTKYPVVKRRDKLPEPKEKEKPIGLWSIIKENIGKDLSGVCLPVYFNEPLKDRSRTQHLSQDPKRLESQRMA